MADIQTVVLTGFGVIAGAGGLVTARVWLRSKSRRLRGLA